MLPSWGGGKAKKREEAARRHEAEEESKREAQRAADLKASASRRAYQESIGQRDYTRSPGYGNYTTPEGIERDDTEQEIDRNLDQLSTGLSRLKMMGHAMNAELEAQQPLTNRIMDKTSRTHERLDNTTRKINRIK